MPEFFDAVASRWDEIVDVQIAQTLDQIIYLSTTYHHAFERNFERHPIMGEHIWNDPAHILEIEDFQGQVDFLLDWLEARIEWLSAFFESGI